MTIRNISRAELSETIFTCTVYGEVTVDSDFLYVMHLQTNVDFVGKLIGKPIQKLRKMSMEISRENIIDYSEHVSHFGVQT